jgi:uncharacterized protein with PhoU and TrkA domain
LLRTEAIDCLKEICDTSDLMLDTTHISLHLFGNNTRLIVHTYLDDSQKQILRQIAAERKLKIVECPDSVWVIY